MKNYKNLIPVLLIALMAISIFTTLKDATNQKSDYDNALKEARKAIKLEIIEDAVNNYQKAMEIKPSVEIAVEWGQAYVAQNWISEAAEWGEDVVERFPDDAEGYTFLMEQYIALEEYEDAFKLLDTAEAMDIKSKELEQMKEKIEYVYEYAVDSFDDVSVFSSGYCAVMKDELWGYVDSNGKKVIKPQFSWAGVFTTDQIAPVEAADGEYYYVSTAGNKKVAVQNMENCIDLGASVENVIPASDNGEYAYYDHDFKKVIDETYTYATAMNGGYAAVQEIDKWALINNKGKKIASGYENVIIDEKGIVFRNDRFFVKKDGCILMVDEKGNTVGKDKYEDAKLFLKADAYAAVKKGGKWGFIDKDGKMIIEPQFSDARSFSNGYAAVEKNGRWGFIDVTGKEVISCRFEDARDFNELGNVYVKDTGNWELLKLLKNNYK